MFATGYLDLSWERTKKVDELKAAVQ